MGHTQMLLAVAGLTEAQIQARTAQLADGEWSEFSPAERVAFRFARKLTRAPSEVSAADVDELAAAYGRTRALDLIWHVAWCNYMTRVAESLQLPLETTNVFAKPAKK